MGRVATPVTRTKVSSVDFGIAMRNDYVSQTETGYTQTIPSPKSASYIIMKSGSTYYAINGTTGVADYSGADATTVVNAAFGGLTAGRTWKEKVVLKGDFTLNRVSGSTKDETEGGKTFNYYYCLSVPSYTVLEIQGKLTSADNQSAILITNASWPTSGDTNIEILNGHLDGNSANNPFEIVAEPCYAPHSIYLRSCDDSVVGGVTIEDSGYTGIRMKYSDRNWIWRNLIDTTADSGIYQNIGNDSTIGRNIVLNNGSDQSIRVQYGSNRNRVINNYIYNPATSAIRVLGVTGSTCTGNIVIGNTMDGNEAQGNRTTKQGISLSGVGYVSDTVVANNYILNCKWGIYDTAGSASIIGNRIRECCHGYEGTAQKSNIVGNDFRLCELTGMYLNGADYLTVVANTIANNDVTPGGWAGMRLATATYNLIKSNQFWDDQGSETQDTAIQELNTCSYNQFSDNYCGGSALPSFAGTATGLPKIVVPFSNGTAYDDSGWDIDAVAEWAGAFIMLPNKLHRIIRLKIYARSIVTEIHGMELDITANGGADNEAYNIEAISVASKGSSSTNFAADDIIHWILTSSDDSDIGDLTGGDSLELKVVYAAVDGDNCATDARFRTVEIEYV